MCLIDYIWELHQIQEGASGRLTMRELPGWKWRDNVMIYLSWGGKTVAAKSDTLGCVKLYGLMRNWKRSGVIFGCELRARSGCSVRRHREHLNQYCGKISGVTLYVESEMLPLLFHRIVIRQILLLICLFSNITMGISKVHQGHLYIKQR